MELNRECIVVGVGDFTVIEAGFEAIEVCFAGGVGSDGDDGASLFLNFGFGLEDGVVCAVFFYIEFEACYAGRADELDDGFPDELCAFCFIVAKDVLAVFADGVFECIEVVVGYDFCLCALTAVFAQVEELCDCGVDIGFEAGDEWGKCGWHVVVEGELGEVVGDEVVGVFEEAFEFVPVVFHGGFVFIEAGFAEADFAFGRVGVGIANVEAEAIECVADIGVY